MEAKVSVLLAPSIQAGPHPCSPFGGKAETPCLVADKVAVPRPVPSPCRRLLHRLLCPC